MAATFTPLSKSVISRPCSFWNLFYRGRLHRHQCLLGSSSSGEGSTNTNAYREALLQGKAAQTPMPTGKLFCWGRLHRHQCQLRSSSAGEGSTDTNAYWEVLLQGEVAQTLMRTGKQYESFSSKEATLDGFPSVSLVVDMARCCTVCLRSRLLY